METVHECVLCGSREIESLDAEFHVCNCRACGLVFENPRPTLASIIEFYSKPVQYDSWLNALGPRDRLWKRRMSKLRGLSKRGNLLDVGAGIGQFLALAKKDFTGVVGTEVSSSAVAIAREKFGLEIRQGVVEDLDFSGQRFDNITLFHVLEHVMHPGRLIRKCRDLLTTDGMLYIAVPNDIVSLGAVKRRIVNRFSNARSRSRGKIGLPKLTLGGEMDEIHLTHFTPKVLARYLAGNGFEVVENSLDPYYVSSGWRLAWMNALYKSFSLFRNLTGVNLYGTIWIVARKH